MINFHLVNGKWLLWEEWADCTELCDTGKRFRNRQCTPPKHGGDNCPLVMEFKRKHVTRNLADARIYIILLYIDIL